VSRRFPIAVCVEGWVIFFIVVASGIDVMVGEVLTESCDCFLIVLLVVNGGLGQKVSPNPSNDRKLGGGR